MPRTEGNQHTTGTKVNDARANSKRVIFVLSVLFTTICAIVLVIAFLFFSYAGIL